MMKIKFGNRITAFYGEISLELYLIHNLVIYILSKLNISKIIFLILVLAISTIIAYILHFAYSKIINIYEIKSKTKISIESGKIQINK